MSIFNKVFKRETNTKIEDQNTNNIPDMNKYSNKTTKGEFDAIRNIAKNSVKTGAVKEVPKAGQIIKRLKLK